MNNLQNLQELDQEQALTLTKFFIRSGSSIFLIGRKGTGKTAIAIQAAQECKYKINYINLSVIERPDLLGYPDLHSPGDTVIFKSPAFLPKLLEKNKPDQVILFDEVDKAPPEVTAPLLEILQFKTINGTPLNVAACILTGNLLNEGAYSNEISTALLDRGAKYILKFDFEKWLEWGKTHNLHDLILGFLRSNPDFACGRNDDLSYASPSPRGWTQASEAIFKAKTLKITDIENISAIVSGFVGNDAGMRFKIWYEYFRKFEPFIQSLIETGILSGLDFHKLMPTEKMIFVISTCYHAKNKFLEKKKTIYIENLIKFFDKYKIDYELQVIGLHNSFTFEFITKNKLYECKSFFNLFNKISQQSFGKSA